MVNFLLSYGESLRIPIGASRLDPLPETRKFIVSSTALAAARNPTGEEKNCTTLSPQELERAVDQRRHRELCLFPTRVDSFTSTVQAQVEARDDRELVSR